MQQKKSVFMQNFQGLFKSRLQLEIILQTGQLRFMKVK